LHIWLMQNHSTVSLKKIVENGIKPSKRTDQRTIPNFLFFLYKKDCYAS